MGGTINDDDIRVFGDTLPIHTMLHHSFGEMLGPHVVAHGVVHGVANPVGNAQGSAHGSDHAVAHITPSGSHHDEFVIASGSTPSDPSEYRLRSSTLFGHHYHKGPGHTSNNASYRSKTCSHDPTVHTRDEGVLGHDEFIIRGSIENSTTGF